MGEANPAIRVRVAGVILNNAGELLVVRQNNKPFWVLPGGTLEFGERLESCLVRELVEELNLSIAVNHLFAVNEFIQPSDDERSGRHVVDHTFVATLLSDESVLVMSDDENLNEVKWVPLDKVEQLPLMSPVIAKQLHGQTPTTLHTVSASYLVG